MKGSCRSLKKILILGFLSFSLTSCSWFNFDNEPVQMDEQQASEGDGYRKVTSFTFGLHDVNKNHGCYNLNSVGNASILLVPVETSDGPSWTETMLTNLETSFLGESNETAWQSVSSFYEQSSYGKLKITGEVASTLKLNYSTKSLASASVDESGSHPDYVALDAFTRDSTYDELRKKYDTDGDGYIDSVVFMYSNAIDNDNGYWAWVYWSSYTANLNYPNVNSYMWVSYDFIIENKKSSLGHYYAAYGNKIDGHTIIHETGHLLGLDDYYNSDDSWDPSGALDMSSNNVGDHSIYSKMVLGWADPYYVKTDSEVTLTLRTSSTYGDAIIINDSWNGSLMDEYIAIEYYSSTGLNSFDSANRYTNGLRMYTTSGFRIYHIDSRVVGLGPRESSSDNFVDDLSNTKLTYIVGPSNTASYSYLKTHRSDYKLVHLLEAGGKNTFKSEKATATNATLFQKGDTFKASKTFFTNGTKFNDGSEVGYEIIIGECSDYKGTITIKKL